MSVDELQLGKLPDLGERTVLIEIIRAIIETIINEAGREISLSKFLGEAHNSKFWKFSSGENALTEGAFIEIRKILLSIDWSTKKFDIEMLDRAFKYYSKKSSIATSPGKFRKFYTNQLELAKNLNDVVSATAISMNDLLQKDGLKRIIQTGIVDRRNIGENTKAALQAIALAPELKAYFEEKNANERFVSWAISSVLDAGSYSAFLGLDTYLISWIGKCYEQFDLSGPIFAITRGQNRHHLASATARRLWAWKSEHDVYPSKVRSASASFAVAQEYFNDEYVAENGEKFPAWRGNGTLELAFDSAPLDLPFAVLEGRSIEKSLLLSAKGAAANGNFEAAGRFYSSLGREYLRRADEHDGYIERAKDMAIRAREKLLKLVSIDETPDMENSYSRRIVEGNCPTAWAGWILLTARIELWYLERGIKSSPGIHLDNWIYDAMELYRSAGAIGFSMSGWMTSRRAAALLRTAAKPVSPL